MITMWTGSVRSLVDYAARTDARETVVDAKTGASIAINISGGDFEESDEPFYIWHGDELYDAYNRRDAVRILSNIRKGKKFPDLNPRRPSSRKPSRSRTTVSDMMNEVIWYGGLPLRRGDVYRDALEATGSQWAADMFAFGPRTRIAEGVEPLSLDEFKDITRRNPSMAMARSMRQRYQEDKRAGHTDAAEYWRGQAAAYFTGNPRKEVWQMTFDEWNNLSWEEKEPYGQEDIGPRIFNTNFHLVHVLRAARQGKRIPKKVVESYKGTAREQIEKEIKLKGRYIRYTNPRKELPSLLVDFGKPMYGYWNGARRGGEFTIEGIDGRWIDHRKYRRHPGPGHDIKWGCYALNYWFTAKSGRDWNDAASIAARTIKRQLRVPGTTVERANPVTIEFSGHVSNPPLHKWIISPRGGRKTKNYTCSRCGIEVVATSSKSADLISPPCVGAMNIPEGLKIGKDSGGWYVYHSKSGAKLGLQRYDDKEFAIDFARRAGLYEDWTKPIEEIRKRESEIAMLIRTGGKRKDNPGYADRFWGMRQESPLSPDVSNLLNTPTAALIDKYGLPRGKDMKRSHGQSEKLIQLAIMANSGASEVAITEHHPSWRVVRALEGLMNGREFFRYEKLINKSSHNPIIDTLTTAIATGVGFGGGYAAVNWGIGKAKNRNRRKR